MGDTVDVQRAFRFLPGSFVVLRADSDFSVVAASEGFFKTTHTDARIMGRPLFAVLAGTRPLDGSGAMHDLRASLARVVATGRPDVAGVNVPILAEDGTVEYVVHRVDDEPHADRERLVSEGETQRRIYETALDSTPDFVYVFDLEHRAIYANAALLRTWGVDAVRGKRWMDLGYEQWHADLHDRELAQVIATRAPIRGEIPFTGTNGRRIYDYIFAPVLGADGEVVAVAGTTRDVTDRLDMIARMLESQRLEAIGILAGGVAHDFNNMLAAILGNVALAIQESDAASPVSDRLHLVHRAAERARALVRQILTFSQDGPKHETVQSLQPIVDEALALLRSTLPAGVLLAVRPSPVPLWACVDGAKFQQLVVNLCTNAWQALHEVGGEICVSLERVRLTAQQAPALQLQPGDHARLTVTDNGRGMDEVVRSRIFEPFFTTKPVGQGTGLGLAVVHSVVKESHGHIQVDSEPGRGTRITILLPLAQEPLNEGVAERGGTPQVAAHSGASVLYVDDDEVVSLTAAALLARAGFSITTVSSGAAALAALKEAADGFAAVVTDFNMPGMSGLGVAEALRRDAPETPVIIISGYVTDDLRRAAHSIGVTEILAKEEMLERLTDSLHRVLARS